MNQYKCSVYIDLLISESSALDNQSPLVPSISAKLFYSNNYSRLITTV